MCETVAAKTDQEDPTPDRADHASFENRPPATHNGAIIVLCKGIKSSLR